MYIFNKKEKRIGSPPKISADGTNALVDTFKCARLSCNTVTFDANTPHIPGFLSGARCVPSSHPCTSVAAAHMLDKRATMEARELSLSLAPPPSPSPSGAPGTACPAPVEEVTVSQWSLHLDRQPKRSVVVLSSSSSVGTFCLSCEVLAGTTCSDGAAAKQ